VVSQQTKDVGSSEGHRVAWTSPLQPGRVADAPRRLEACRAALLSRDFDSLAQITEQDCLLMHAVMMTSKPPLFYWEPASLRLMKLIPEWRRLGLPVCYTLDAGPNVHVISPAGQAGAVAAQLKQVEGVLDVLNAPVGPAAHLVES
jgi:diphosphomevalonate decarboxylase